MGDSEKLQATISITTKVNMQTKLVTSTSRVPALETAAIENQDSINSHQYENPFREEGDLSEYAKDVVDAVKSGNLDKLVPEADAEHPEPARDTELLVDKNPPKSTKEIKIEHSLVISPKHSEIEHIVIPEKKPRR